MNVRFFGGRKSEYAALSKHNQVGLFLCADTRELFWGDWLLSDGIRIVPTYADLPSISEYKAAEGIIYFVEDTKNGYVLPSGGKDWVQVIYAPVDGPGADLSNYYTKVEVDEAILAAIANIEIPQVDLTGYATESFVAEKINELNIPSIEGLATETYVDSKFAEVKVPANVSELANDAGYITSEQTDERLQNYVSNEVYEINQAVINNALNNRYNKTDADKRFALNANLNELAEKVDTIKIPTSVSELVNDTGYITAEDIPEISIPDTSSFITMADVEAKGYLTEHQSIEHLATKEELESAINSVDHPVVDLSGYATEEFVINKIAEAELSSGDEPVDLSGYATKEDIKNFITEVPEEYITENELNAKGFITEHQDLSDYAKKDELFSKSYNDLTDTPEIPDVTGLASEAYVIEKLNALNIPEVPTNVSAFANDAGYLTEHQDLSEYAKKTDIPVVTAFATKEELNKAIEEIEHPTVDLDNYVTREEISDFISEIPLEYVTESELEAKGYLTEHQDLSNYVTHEELPSTEGLATEEFVNDAIANIEIPEVDLNNYYTKAETASAISSALTDKADKVLFTTSKFVTKPVGDFQTGEDVNGYTIAQLFAKLLGLSDGSVNPDLPENPDGIVNSIIANKTALYQINDYDQIVEVPYVYLDYTEAEAATRDYTTGFYQIINTDGTAIESGYQHFSTKKEPYYIVALPDVLTVTPTGNVELQTWNELENKWGPADYILTGDYTEIVNVYNLDGIEPPIAPEGYRLWADLSTPDTGNSYRFIIKE